MESIILNILLLSLTLRLETTDNDSKELLETMRRYNEACNFVSDKAFSLKLTNKYKLHKIVYAKIRDKFNLSSQFAVRIISKVVEAYKRDKNIKAVFRPLGAIQYDQRNSKVRIDEVSLMTLNKGRIKLRTRIGNYQKLRFRRVKGQCDLYYDKRTKTFYLIVVVDAAEQSQYDHVDVLGVDMGIENIATDSDNQIFESSKVEQIRKRYARLRSRLQHVGTKSAKRKLRKLTGKERRFKKDVNHVISKNIVEKAKGTTRGIGLEDLKNIHSRVTVKIRHSQRDRHHRWSFDELRKCIEYKAKVLGVPIFVVDPKNTSRQCPNPECQYIDKRNRKTRDLFQCLQCRFTAMADYVAAINIRLKAKIMAATVNQPIVGETLISTYKPPILIGGS